MPSKKSVASKKCQSCGGSPLLYTKEIYSSLPEQKQMPVLNNISYNIPDSSFAGGNAQKKKQTKK